MLAQCKRRSAHDEVIERGHLQAEIGHDPGPGQATLYGTTALFLERLGLDRVEDLPPLGQFVPGGDVVETLERTLLADGDPRRRTRTPAARPDPPAGSDAALDGDRALHPDTRPDVPQTPPVIDLTDRADRADRAVRTWGDQVWGGVDAAGSGVVDLSDSGVAGAELGGPDEA